MAVLCVVAQRQTGRRVQFSLVDSDGLKTHESKAQVRCQLSGSSDDVSDGYRGERDAESPWFKPVARKLPSKGVWRGCLGGRQTH